LVLLFAFVAWAVASCIMPQKDIELQQLASTSLPQNYFRYGEQAHPTSSISDSII
jgi:hypothetical protein